MALDKSSTAKSEYSDQTAWIRSLTWVFTFRACIIHGFLLHDWYIVRGIWQYCFIIMILRGGVCQVFVSKAYSDLCISLDANNILLSFVDTQVLMSVVLIRRITFYSSWRMSSCVLWSKDLQFLTGNLREIEVNFSENGRNQFWMR